MLDAVNAPQKIAVSKTYSKTQAPASKPQSGAQRLVRWHLTALGLLAVFSVGGQVIVQSAMHMLPAGTPTVALAARQEALGQHLVLSALALQASETPAQRIGWETDLRDTAALWKQSAAALPQASPAIAAKLADAAPHQQAMLDAAQGLLAALPPDRSRQKTDVSRYLTPLFQNQKAYDDGMDMVVAEYSREAASHLALLRGIQGGLCLLTLLALAALGLLISKPKFGSVSRTIAELDDMEEKRGEMDAALSEADRQIAQMRETLENLSTVDALTGLVNHRAFQEQLDRELGRALRHNQPLSLLLLDIDKFKSYNDSYSHADGDQALKVIAGLMKETARASDIPARYGSKQFAIILTETDMMGAMVLGERLRQAVASADGLQRPLTASIGITTLTPSVFSTAAFLAQAARALNHAKGDGRNRVSHAQRIPADLEDAAPIYARAA
jgi:diguanylate cyclase (GGDEF)-like protein